MNLTIEILGAVFGFFSVYFTIKESIWCWFFGLIQVILYCFVFFAAQLYSDFILHVIYIFLNVLGWYTWKYGGKNNSDLKITTLTNLLLWIGITLLGTTLLGYVMVTKTDATFPYPDAFTTVASLVAQYLMIKKRLQSWYFWIVVDIVAIIVYWNKDLYFTTVLYLLFLVMAVLGYLQWQNKVLENNNHEATL